MTQIFQQTADINPVHTKQGAAHTSKQYRHVNTESVIDVFTDAGLELVGTSYAKPKNVNRAGYQKHVTVFNTDLPVDGGQLQLLLTNSHDGRSSFQIDIGVYRFVCANGLVCGDTYGTERVRHVGSKIYSQIDEAIQRQLDRLPAVAQGISRMQNYILSGPELGELARGAVDIRIGEDKAQDYDPGNIDCQRTGDCSDDLWTFFNILQEKMIRGGLRYLDKEDNIKSTRRITSVSRKLELNKKLWTLAESIAA